MVMSDYTHLHFEPRFDWKSVILLQQGALHNIYICRLTEVGLMR